MRRVYFIKPIDMQGPVKIGCSYSPNYRRRALATWSPFPLEIIAEIQGDYRLERRFHTRFVDDHRGHEWFTWSKALQETIDAINAGIFDVSTLPDPKHLPRSPEARRAEWTPQRKRLQSYALRLMHIQKKKRFFLPPELVGWRGFMDDAARMARIDAFIADPARHGLSHDQEMERRKAYLRGLNTEFANKLLAQVEAA